METGDYDEAEAVYRADLGLDEKLPRPIQHPRNVWALHGLHECLVRRGEKVELQHVKLLLAQAVARAKVFSHYNPYDGPRGGQTHPGDNIG